MIPLLGAQFVSVTPAARGEAQPNLPWPSGSLLSAKISDADGQGGALLQLGSYRLRAQVPPNTPMGNIWLQLISSEMPAQFRLLTESRAAALLSEMMAAKMKTEGQALDPARQQAGRSPVDQGWSRMEQVQVPLHGEISGQGDRLMLRDPNDGSDRGVIQRSSDAQKFLLHGRIDMDHLGPVAFSLEGHEGNPWKLRVYAGHDGGYQRLRQEFTSWLHERQELSSGQVVEGVLQSGLPENQPSLKTMQV